MAGSPVERRLVALVMLDLVGYTRLMGQDERGTFERVAVHRREVVEPIVAAHRGRIVKLTGDGALCELPSLVEAVECARLLQRATEERERGLPEERRLRLRIGVAIGDVIQDETGDVFGEGVNLAARLEGLAEPGGICLSATAYEEVRGKIDCRFEDLGERTLKNIERPVRVFRLIERGPSIESGAGAPRGPAAAVSPQRPSIAVLPFLAMGPDPEQEVFADGITEDVTTALCRLKGFFVISRSTMFTYKGRSVDVRALGPELGVRYALEGSVRRAGSRIRVTAQLLEVATGGHLWAERYDGELADVFAIQDEITSAVVGRLGPELLAAEHARARRTPTQSLDAWECVIRALAACSEQSEEASRAALVLLDRAIALDPGYALALGMKGWIHVFRAFQGWEPMPTALALAGIAIARGRAADPDEPWPWLALGMVGFATRDNEGATSALERAVALNPNSVNAHGLLGVAHAFGGRTEAALAAIDRAARSSPRAAFLSDIPLYYAFALLPAGDWEGALRHALDAHRAHPGHPYPLIVATACAGRLGRAEAGSLLAELRALVPIVSASWIEATAPYVRAEDRLRLVEGLVAAGLA